MIEWEDGNNTVGPIAAAAKESLLRLIPHIMPVGSDQGSLLSPRSRPQRFRHSQYVNYNGCKRATLRDVLVRLGDWVHRAGYFVRSVDGSGRRSSDR
jgi:hypothetical protein